MVTEIQIAALLESAYSYSDLPLPGKQSGKVRDWYPLRGGARRLLIATDRLSAFDRILASVPYKGQVLNQLSAWWFGQTGDLIPNHLIEVPDPNAMLVHTTMPFPVEVVVRGFITGVTGTALWRRYELGEREIYGYRFEDGLRKNQVLPAPIITPTTKGGPASHDECLTVSEVVTNGIVAPAHWEAMQAAALTLFGLGQEIASRAGLILVDTKYEFGLDYGGRLLLIDEVHTPDSSRFWLANSYEERIEAGLEPRSFDKEFIRLAYAARGYRGEGNPPELPPELWIEVSQRYIAIYEMLTGKAFLPGPYPVDKRLSRVVAGLTAH